jgi:spectinomycin phosphotransferase
LRTAPEGLADTSLITALAEGWGLTAIRIEYVPEGGGSYHWRVADDAGRRYFVTVDDLDHKAYLGANRDFAFEGLRRALDTAAALRHEAGLEFVVAPLPTAEGETVKRIDPRHTVAVYPFIKGTSLGFEASLEQHERAALVRMLARLHDVDDTVARFAGSMSSALPERRSLESALGQLDVEWMGGPLSEPARLLLATHAARVRQLLKTFDELAARVDAANAGPVITHGEPHGGNLIRSDGQLLFIDWDTVGLAPCERDLWMLAVANPGDLEQYAQASGRSVNPDAIALYRLRWQLDDISLFVDDLRSPHERTGNIEHAWSALVKSMPH